MTSSSRPQSSFWLLAAVCIGLAGLVGCDRRQPDVPTPAPPPTPLPTTSADMGTGTAGTGTGAITGQGYGTPPPFGSTASGPMMPGTASSAMPGAVVPRQ
jgi:hypothetical protein